MQYNVRLLEKMRTFLRNINWQDYKYPSFVIFICYSVQSKYSTSQCHKRRITCCGRRRKHRVEITITKTIFNQPLLCNEQRISMQDKLSNKIQIDAKHYTQW